VKAVSSLDASISDATHRRYDRDARAEENVREIPGIDHFFWGSRETARGCLLKGVLRGEFCRIRRQDGGAFASCFPASCDSWYAALPRVPALGQGASPTSSRPCWAYREPERPTMRLLKSESAAVHVQPGRPRLPPERHSRLGMNAVSYRAAVRPGTRRQIRQRTQREQPALPRC
jgi:hypothetical protein